MKKTWTKPTITETPIVENSGCLPFVLAIIISLFAFSSKAQTVQITEGCSSGVLTDYVLPKTSVNDSGYNVYQSGNRFFQYNVVSKRWEYSVGGNVLFFNTVKSAKPLAPCSFKFDYTHVSTCSDTTFNVLTDCTTLPVELLYFNASSTNKGILLKWKTASEINNCCFKVEYSTGLNFYEAARVEAKGSNSEYSYIHNHTSKGILYYRLKQIDNDGNETVSKVVSVNNSTPSVSQLLDGVVYAQGRIEIYNLSGQLLGKGEDAFNLLSLTNNSQILVVKTDRDIQKYLKP